jgi:hypothetical protein
MDQNVTGNLAICHIGIKIFKIKPLKTDLKLNDFFGNSMLSGFATVQHPTIRNTEQNG